MTFNIYIYWIAEIDDDSGRCLNAVCVYGNQLEVQDSSRPSSEHNEQHTIVIDDIYIIIYIWHYSLTKKYDLTSVIINDTCTALLFCVLTYSLWHKIKRTSYWNHYSTVHKKYWIQYSWHKSKHEQNQFYDGNILDPANYDAFSIDGTLIAPKCHGARRYSV